MSEIRIESSSFEEILPYWRDYLWPERKSKIEACSAIHHDGHIAIEIMKAEPLFWKAIKDDTLVGVMSGAATSPEYFRSRGLWVKPDFRNQGIACAMMAHMALVAAKAGHTQAWAMTRPTSLQFYLKNGFRVYTQVKAYEFGPHYFVKKMLITL